ncbi:MAG: MiaB/RimO family radical SAM methylthiotransferase [Promethearchaeota archaeon]
MKGKKIYIDYIGCEKRKLDAQRILNFFLANNYEISNNPEQSNYIIYITCAFNKQFEDISINRIQNLYKNLKNGKKLIIGGCLTEINPKRLINHSNLKLLKVRDIEFIDDLFDHLISIKDIPDPNITDFENIHYETRVVNEYRTPAHKEYEDSKKGFKIRINYGCLGNCSYCVTKFATKSLKSKPLKSIIKNFQSAIQDGYKTILFTGGDTGAYGLDISLTIVDLMREIFKINGNYKIYFHDFGIHWLIKYFNELFPIFLRNNKKIGIFNFPIQSGSNKILKLMKRPYKIEDVKKCLNKLKQEIPNLQFGTHIIVGFPYEEEEDFQKTINLIKEIPFDFLMVFKYSDNPLAESHKINKKIDELTIHSRYKILLDTFLKKIEKGNYYD